MKSAKAFNTAIAKLMLILSNKLASISREADKQNDVENQASLASVVDCNSLVINLIRALSLQAIIWLVTWKATSKSSSNWYSENILMISWAMSKSCFNYIWKKSALYERSFTFEKFALCNRFSIAPEDGFFFLSLRPLFDLIQNTQEFDS